SGGSCASSCNDQCAGGQKRCSGANVQSCDLQSNGCYDWSATASCQTNYTCTGFGQCTLACSDSCTPGSRQCSGDLIQDCVIAPSGRLVTPRGSVSVRVMDPDGTEVLKRDVALTAFGTFRVETALPRSARLGRYSVEVSKESSLVYARFEVGEYRTASFEVKLPPAGEAERDANGDVVLPVRAAYYYGAPVRGGHVAWSASWRGRAPFFGTTNASLAAFSFASDSSDGDAFLTSGTLDLDDAGTGTIHVPAESLAATLTSRAQAVDLVVEAQVTDAADDVLSASTVQALSAASALVGVDNQQWVVSAPDGWDVRLATVDTTGAAKAGQALVASLVRQTWVSAAEEGEDGPSYGGRYEDRVVETKELTSGAEPLRVHFAVPGGGEYRVDVRAAGATGVASASVWAYGGQDFYGPARNDSLVDVRPDRPSYAPGDVAHLVVASPYEQATALVTTEREGILEAHVVALRGASTPLDVPVREGHVPNVYVGVALVPRSPPPPRRRRRWHRPRPSRASPGRSAPGPCCCRWARGFSVARRRSASPRSVADRATSGASPRPTSGAGTIEGRKATQCPTPCYWRSLEASARASSARSTCWTRCSTSPPSPSMRSTRSCTTATWWTTSASAARSSSSR
ncbi:MAG: MG2 domain-containing protein, partial [Chloroflexota bacterium]